MTSPFLMHRNHHCNIRPIHYLRPCWRWNHPISSLDVVSALWTTRGRSFRGKGRLRMQVSTQKTMEIIVIANQDKEIHDPCPSRLNLKTAGSSQRWNRAKKHITVASIDCPLQKYDSKHSDAVHRCTTPYRWRPPTRFQRKDNPRKLLPRHFISNATWRSIQLITLRKK